MRCYDKFRALHIKRVLRFPFPRKRYDWNLLRVVYSCVSSTFSGNESYLMGTLNHQLPTSSFFTDCRFGWFRLKCFDSYICRHLSDYNSTNILSSRDLFVKYDNSDVIQQGGYLYSVWLCYHYLSNRKIVLAVSGNLWGKNLNKIDVSGFRISNEA